MLLMWKGLWAWLNTWVSFLHILLTSHSNYENCLRQTGYGIVYSRKTLSSCARNWAYPLFWHNTMWTERQNVHWALPPLGSGLEGVLTQRQPSEDWCPIICISRSMMETGRRYGPDRKWGAHVDLDMWAFSVLTGQHALSHTGWSQASHFRAGQQIAWWLATSYPEIHTVTASLHIEDRTCACTDPGSDNIKSWILYVPTHVQQMCTNVFACMVCRQYIRRRTWGMAWSRK